MRDCSESRDIIDSITSGSVTTPRDVINVHRSTFITSDLRPVGCKTVVYIPLSNLLTYDRTRPQTTHTTQTTHALLRARRSPKPSQWLNKRHLSTSHEAGVRRRHKQLHRFTEFDWLINWTDATLVVRCPRFRNFRYPVSGVWWVNSIDVGGLRGRSAESTSTL